MERKTQSITGRVLSTVLIPLLFAACLDSKPNILKNKLGEVLDLSPADTANSSNFQFSFAYNAGSKKILASGVDNSQSAFKSTCGANGSFCLCNYYDSSGAILEAATVPIYDDAGNYYQCTYSGGTAPSSIAITNQTNTKATSKVSVTPFNQLTVQQLIGSAQTVSRVRTVSLYQCTFNFLQKAGTTENYFDCSNQAAVCPTVGGTTNFCELSVSYPFYLYSDSLSSNVSQKMVDKLYGGGGTQCSLQIKYIDCTGTNGTPAADFGLYADQQGVFQTPIALSPGPGKTTSVYGYAASVSTTTGLCPPGLAQVRLYVANPNAGTISPASNVPASAAAFTAARVASSAPTTLAMNQISGGACDSAKCTRPTSAPVLYQSLAFGVAPAPNNVDFCVIPATCLDNNVCD